MEPLSDAVQRKILARGVTQEELEEYHTLAAKRFTCDPDAPETEETQREKERLTELNKKFVQAITDHHFGL